MREKRERERGLRGEIDWKGKSEEVRLGGRLENEREREREWEGERADSD